MIVQRQRQTTTEQVVIHCRCFLSGLAWISQRNDIHAMNLMTSHQRLYAANSSFSRLHVCNRRYSFRAFFCVAVVVVVFSCSFHSAVLTPKTDFSLLDGLHAWLHVRSDQCKIKRIGMCEGWVRDGTWWIMRNVSKPTKISRPQRTNDELLRWAVHTFTINDAIYCPITCELIILFMPFIAYHESKHLHCDGGDSS